MLKKTLLESLGLFIGLIFISLTIQCGGKQATGKVPPQDILGISVGMNKADAQKRLEEIAQFVSEDRKAGQLWQLRTDPQFANVAVAYDKEQKIRFVTALVNKETAKERIRFTEVADLTKAKAEIVEPHYRYIWEVAPQGQQPAQIFIAYGDNPDSVTLISLSKKIEAKVGGEEEPEEEEED